MKRLALIALLVAAPAYAVDGPEPPMATAAKVTLPPALTGKVGEWIIVPVTALDGSDVRWYLPDAKKADGSFAHFAAEADPFKGLCEVPLASLFGDEWALKAKGRVFKSDVPGTFRVVAYCAKADKSSPISVCSVTVVGDVPPPTPGPTPPGPTPGPTPGPAPIPADGLHVLFVYDSANLAKLPKEQLSILYDTSTVRPYLDSHCAKGPDGKTPEWRCWDANVPTGAESKVWQDAMARKRDSLPWLVVSNGKAGFEGPLPANKDETLKVIKQFGGN